MLVGFLSRRYTRPYACAGLLATWDEEDGYGLYMLQPSGVVNVRFFLSFFDVCRRRLRFAFDLFPRETQSSLRQTRSNNILRPMPFVVLA